MPDLCTLSPTNLEPDATELALIRDRHANERARETACMSLLSAWEPSIVRMARRYAPRRCARADFAQVGRMALLRAAYHYQKAEGRRFENYARRCLRNALIDEARRARREGLRPPVTLAATCCETGLAQLVRAEARGLVRERVSRWVRRLRILVDMLYLEELTQVEAARRLSLTPARISQLCQRIRHQGQRDFADLADLV